MKKQQALQLVSSLDVTPPAPKKRSTPAQAERMKLLAAH